MKQAIAIFGLLLALAVMFTLNQPGQLSAADTFNYVGVSKCKICHKGEKKGNIFEIWSESGHADAYNTLATDAAREAASKLGIEDPQKSDKCLKCHVTAFGVDEAKIEDSFDIADGVQCEACHGPGSEYKSMKVMKALTEGTQEPAEVGLVVPDEKLCVSCHNEESPTYKPFTYAEFYKKIEHKVPEK